MKRLFAVLAVVMVLAAVAFVAVQPDPIAFAQKNAGAGLAAFALLAGITFATQHNLGAAIKVYRAAANLSNVAAAGQDGAEQTGIVIDRLVAGAGKALSAVFAIPYTATLAAAATFKLAYTIESSDAADMSGSAVLKTAAAAVVATGAGGGSTETGCFEVDVDLAAAGRYVRLKYTPDLSAGAVDTSQTSAVAVLGGFDQVPV